MNKQVVAKNIASKETKNIEDLDCSGFKLIENNSDLEMFLHILQEVSENKS